MAQVEKAVFFDPTEPAPSYITVQFNPNSLEFGYGKEGRRKQKKEKGTRKEEQQQQQSPLDAWNSSTLSMRLFFNTYVSETDFTDVRDKIKPLRAFLCKTEDKNQVCNKKIQFAWGTFAFEGYLNSLRVTFQMFGADGTPVRAEVSLSISGEESDISDELRQYQLKQAGFPAAGVEKTKKDFDWLFT